jgi:hypothetical protein
LFSDDQFKCITGRSKPNLTISVNPTDSYEEFLESFYDIMGNIEIDACHEMFAANCKSEIKVEPLSEDKKELIKFLNAKIYVSEARGRLMFLLNFFGCSIEYEDENGSNIFLSNFI